MHLKSIHIAGFKSFVETTKIDFHDNISAIVGPNGCGKSNIIDAIRWVLGESSTRHLRGENASDVIFNGTQRRRMSTYARVELIFELNEKGFKIVTFDDKKWFYRFFWHFHGLN